MHENILDVIEKPTATNRDFAWFVAKWGMIWAIVTYTGILGMEYARKLVIGEKHSMTAIYGDSTLAITGIATSILFIIVLCVTYYFTLRQATKNLNYDFVKNWKTLLFLLFMVLFVSSVITNLYSQIEQIFYYIEHSYTFNDYPIQQILWLPLRALTFAFFASLLFSPIFYFFYKKLKNEQAE
jgi:hypothetical protein